MRKNQLRLAGACLAGVLLYFLLPAANGLTTAGVHMLAVFMPTI